MKTILTRLLFVMILMAASAFADPPANCPTCTPPNLIYAAEKAAADAQHAESKGARRKVLEKGLHWAGVCVKKFPDNQSCLQWQAKLQELLKEKHPAIAPVNQ